MNPLNKIAGARDEGANGHSAVRAVMNFVEQRIRDDAFDQGRLPSESEIAGLVGVSRTPVREAMKILNAVGIIDIRRGIGTFVAPQAKNAFEYLLLFQTVTQRATPRQLFEARLMVEQTAAELAIVNASAADLARIRAANETLRRLAEMPEPDLDEVTEADIEFHRTIFEVCGNPLIGAIGKLTVEQVRPWIRISHEVEGPMVSVAIHGSMISAIEQKNAVEARKMASARAVWAGLADWEERLSRK